MGLDFGQVKVTKEGFLTDEMVGYDQGWLINIQTIYEKILGKDFPMESMIADNVYCNHVDDKYKDEDVITKYYPKYKEDLKEFNFEEFRKFKNITIEDIKKYMDSHEDEHSYGTITSIFTDELQNETMEEAWNDILKIFDEVLKWVDDGYIYYYIIS